MRRVSVVSVAFSGLAQHVASALDMMPLIPHHVQKARRLKELQIEDDGNTIFDDHNQYRRRAEAQQVGALYHGYGTHYADVWVGSPPQRQTVIVDTGSSLTAFPCSGCDDCGAPDYHIDNYFDFEASSTFVETECSDCQRGTCSTSSTSGSGQCKISMRYQEGSSWYAFEANDITYVGGPHSVALLDDVGTEDIDPYHAKHFNFPMTFGCQFKLTGLFKTQLADGIMGMENAKTSFWKQMYDNGKMGDEQKFSLCFSRPPQADREGTEAGAMTFGGVERRLHSSDMVYTAKASGRSGFFSVKLRNVYLRHGDGGESAKSAHSHAKVINLAVTESNLNSGGVIVDSGTTDTYFTKKLSNEFRAAFKELSGHSFSHTGKKMSAEDLASYPTILFQLYGDEAMNSAISSKPKKVVGLAGALDPDHPYDVILALPPSHYMELNSSGEYVPRFYDTESSGSVIGANTMMGHDVMFDADNLNIGWAESECDYKRLVTDAGYTDAIDVDGSAVVDSNENGSSDLAKNSDAVSSSKDKKKSPPTSSGDAHDSQLPVDDIKKTMNTWAEQCDSFFCQGGVIATIVISFLMSCYCCKCCCRPKKQVPAFKVGEMELSEGNGFRDEDAYTDDPDAEYGEFVTTRRVV